MKSFAAIVLVSAAVVSADYGYGAYPESSYVVPKSSAPVTAYSAVSSPAPVSSYTPESSPAPVSSYVPVSSYAPVSSAPGPVYSTKVSPPVYSTSEYKPSTTSVETYPVYSSSATKYAETSPSNVGSRYPTASSSWVYPTSLTTLASSPASYPTGVNIPPPVSTYVPVGTGGSSGVGANSTAVTPVGYPTKSPAGPTTTPTNIQANAASATRGFSALAAVGLVVAYFL